ncbi:MAG: hypothetical protein ACE5EK_02420 [Nitrospinales bacterium]
MDNEKKTQLDEKWRKRVTQAVTSDEFKGKLVADPISVMKENELKVPEGVKVHVGADKIVNLIVSQEASEEIKSEVQWWRVRLDTISEFGKEERSKSPTIVAPDTEEGV